jgi:hypothetical protein
VANMTWYRRKIVSKVRPASTHRRITGDTPSTPA